METELRTSSQLMRSPTAAPKLKRRFFIYRSKTPVQAQPSTPSNRNRNIFESLRINLTDIDQWSPHPKRENLQEKQPSKSGLSTPNNRRNHSFARICNKYIRNSSLIISSEAQKSLIMKTIEEERKQTFHTNESDEGTGAGTQKPTQEKRKKWKLGNPSIKNTHNKTSFPKFQIPTFQASLRQPFHHGKLPRPAKQRKDMGQKKLKRKWRPLRIENKAHSNLVTEFF